MDLRDTLYGLAAALGAGMLIGAEREQSAEHPGFGGVRTFPLIALAAALGMLVGPWLVVLLGMLLGVFLTVAYVRESAQGARPGITSETAAVVVFALGAFATARELPLPQGTRLFIVGAGACATLGLLASRRPLHGLLAQVSEADVTATTKLLAIALVVLPLLPDHDLGPWGALNPRRIGLLVLLVSVIGFVGYVAVRTAGVERGLGFTGLLGGLSSSTAVTLAFAPRARVARGLVSSFASAIIVASATMFPRVLALVAAADPPLVRRMLPPLAAAGTAGLAVGGGFYLLAARERRRGPRTDDAVVLSNPFSLTSALRFGLMFTGIQLVSRAAVQYLGHAGVYAAAVLTGIAEVDAITLSLVGLHHRGALTADAAVNGIALAAATNTVVKMVLAAALGGLRLGARVGLALTAALAAGALAMILVR